jgi:hypothetical protein
MLACIHTYLYMHIIETAYPIVEKLAQTTFRFSPISGQMFFLAMADYNFTNKQKLQMVYKWYTNGIQMVYKSSPPPSYLA